MPLVARISPPLFGRAASPLSPDLEWSIFGTPVVGFPRSTYTVTVSQLVEEEKWPNRECDVTSLIAVKKKFLRKEEQRETVLTSSAECR